MRNGSRWFFSHNWLVKKIVYAAVKEMAAKYAHGVLLDIGCGEKPYESVFSPYIHDYIGLDHEISMHDTSKVDIFATAYDTTIANESVDTIVCLSVLEHLERPWDAIKEMNRILKPNGHVIVTAQFFWHLHEEPRDFYRYTEYGIKYLLENNGFEVLELNPLSGFCVTFGQEFVYYLFGFRRGGRLNPLWWIIPIVGGCLQGLCYLLNKFDNSEKFTFLYLVVARKK